RRVGKASIGLGDSSPACLDHEGSFPYELVHQIACGTAPNFRLSPLFSAWQPSRTGLFEARLPHTAQLARLYERPTRHIPYFVPCLAPHPIILWKDTNLRLTIDSRGLQSNANNQCAFIARWTRSIRY